jgi:hypothetical protein
MLDALNAQLATLGPWGIVAGIALTIGVQFLRKRLNVTLPTLPANPSTPANPAPVNPAPVPVPVPVPVPAPQSDTPILDAVVSIIRTKLLQNRKGGNGRGRGIEAGNGHHPRRCGRNPREAGQIARL